MIKNDKSGCFLGQGSNKAKSTAYFYLLQQQMSKWIFKIFNAVTNLVWCHGNGVRPWQGGNPLRENWTNGLIGRCFLHIRNLLELEQLKAWKVTVIWATFILGGQFFIHMQKFFFYNLITLSPIFITRYATSSCLVALFLFP